MAKVKYYAKENSTIGTHSFYAVPIPNGIAADSELRSPEHPLDLWSLLQSVATKRTERKKPKGKKFSSIS